MQVSDKLIKPLTEAKYLNADNVSRYRCIIRIFFEHYALAIYQLIRPGNAKFVTVMPYLWNGKKKELLEREEEVEQRGAGLDSNE